MGQQIIAPLSGTVSAAALLNVRSGSPSLKAKIASKASLGTVLAVHALVRGDAVAGNDEWYALDNDTYVWSGACKDFVSPAAGPMGVHRRPNGTVRQLSQDEIRKTYGNFTWSEGAKGAIDIDQAWAEKNIARLPTPILADAGFPAIQCHIKARDAFSRVFAAIAAAGLAGKILKCAGTFVPRHMGWDPARSLSSHSWGIAIDLNHLWNAYGAVPAALGAKGSTRELIPYFAAEGFAWGGDFQPQAICDGMHFELARFDL